MSCIVYMWEQVGTCALFDPLPPRNGDELVPSDVFHWLFPTELYLGLTKLGTDGILRSREDSRYITVSLPRWIFSSVRRSSKSHNKLFFSINYVNQPMRKCERFLHRIVLMCDFFNILSLKRDKKKLRLCEKCVKKISCIYNISLKQ